MINPETGEQISYGEEGEMIVKGPQVMKGYLKNPEATKSTLKDGWLYTGPYDANLLSVSDYILTQGDTKTTAKIC